jgi:CRP/FNR family cyclic AMP-dependent transcriptional regulator
MSIDAAIAKCPVFEGVGVERVRAMLASGERRILTTGEILIDEGVPNEHLYLVISGRLRVMLPANEMRTSAVPIADLGAGDITGEYSAFDKRDAIARVSVVETTEVLSQRGSDFVAALDANPTAAKYIYRNLLELLLKRVEEKDAQVPPIVLV